MGLLLAACTAAAGDARTDGSVDGYLYHDGIHQSGSAPSSAQARYNATHGTWLWPPAESDRPD